MSIKLGNLDVESFKVGSGDCSIYLGTTLLYSGGTPPAPHDYSQDYLTFRALEDGNIYWSGSTTSNTLSYSTDSGSTWSTPSSSFTVLVSSGDTVLFKGECTPNKSKPYGIGRFSGTTADFDVEGNIMSLLYGDNFSGQTSLEGKDYTFYGLFSGCTTLISAESLSLPTTTLASHCYQYMFANCTNLTTAPSALPATTLGVNCYANMFHGCSSLTTAPELKATKLATECYSNMFNGCTSLTTAPSELPAETLAQSCYSNMFNGCTNLTTVPELPATTLANYCYSNMFSYCTSLTTAPELPATRLAMRCYQMMFYNCINLNNITCLATNISASKCTNQWVLGVQTSSGTFTKAASMTRWTSGNDGIPNNWTVQDYSS